MNVYNPTPDPSAQRLINGQPLANLTPDFLAQLSAAGAMGHLTGPGGLTYGQVGVQSSGEDGNGYTQQGYQAFDPNHNVKGDAQGLFALNGNFAGLQTNDNGKYDGWWAPLAAVGAGMALGSAGAGATGAGMTDAANIGASNALADGSYAGADWGALGGAQGAGGMSGMDLAADGAASGANALGGFAPNAGDLAVQGNSINALDNATGVGYGSAPSAGMPWAQLGKQALSNIGQSLTKQGQGQSSAGGAALPGMPAAQSQYAGTPGYYSIVAPRQAASPPANPYASPYFSGLMNMGR